MKREVIVHYHIFKNAGWSVEKALETALGGAVGSIHGPDPWSVITSGELTEYILSNLHVSAVTSHHLRPPLPQDDSLDIYPIIFLRHPVDRVGSAYEFERRCAGEGLGSKVAKEKDFAGYIRWRLSSDYALPVRDFQVISLSSAQLGNIAPLQARPDASHLEEAVKFIESLPCFGIVERYEESAMRFERFLEPHFPGLKLSGKRHNVSENRAETLSDRITAIEKSLGKELYAELLRENALDIQLYERAVSLFEGKKSG